MPALQDMTDELLELRESVDMDFVGIGPACEAGAFEERVVSSAVVFTTGVAPTEFSTVGGNRCWNSLVLAMMGF